MFDIEIVNNSWVRLKKYKSDIIPQVGDNIAANAFESREIIETQVVCERQIFPSAPNDITIKVIDRSEYAPRK